MAFQNLGIFQIGGTLSNTPNLYTYVYDSNILTDPYRVFASDYNIKPGDVVLERARTPLGNDETVYLKIVTTDTQRTRLGANAVTEVSGTFDDSLVENVYTATPSNGAFPYWHCIVYNGPLTHFNTASFRTWLSANIQDYDVGDVLQLVGISGTPNTENISPRVGILRFERVISSVTRYVQLIETGTSGANFNLTNSITNLTQLAGSGTYPRIYGLRLNVLRAAIGQINAATTDSEMMDKWGALMGPGDILLITFSDNSNGVYVVKSAFVSNILNLQFFALG